MNIPAYRLDLMDKGAWLPLRPYPHTITGMREAFNRADDYINARISVRVIDTTTGEMIMEANV